LRDRKEDIRPLADFFLKKSSIETGKNINGFVPTVLDIFLEYPWPGNLREFRNVVRRAVLLTPADNMISVQSLPKDLMDYRQNPGMSTNGKNKGCRDRSMRSLRIKIHLKEPRAAPNMIRS
jgi:two-component system response regulator HydG